jgi:hypothetical protein
MAKHDELTIIAGILTIIAFSFFMYSIHITKITDNLTYLWIFLILLTQTLLFIYGKINNILGIYFPAIIIFIGMFYILYIKVTFTYNETNNLETELKDKEIILENNKY